LEIDRIGVALRPRDTHEALDLGAALLRQHARQIYAAWFPLTLPFFVIAAVLPVFTGKPWISLLLLWLLKPLFARVPLFVVSRAVFAQAPDWRSTLRGVKAWGGAGLLGWLTLGRFDARRAIRQPLLYLEGLDRRERASRWRVFGRGLDGAAYESTLTCLAFELVLMASVLLFVPLFVPTELWSGGVFDTLRWGAMPPSLSVGIVVAYYIAITVTEPLYTASGFALYLNRRTRLEAWDIDLSFRRLRERLLAAGATAILLFAVMAAPRPASAAEAKPKVATVSVDAVFAQPPTGADQRTAQAAQAVFADPHFGGERKRMTWGFRDRFKPKFEPPKVEEVRREPIGTGLAVKGVLLACLAVAAVWLAWFAARRYGGRVAASPAAPVARPSEATLSPSVAATPARLADAVLALWRKGERRDALALLYRGTVERMAQRLDTPVHPDATEADAVAQARLLNDAEASRRVARIVRTWQFAAYADRYPSDDDMTTLLSGWPAEAS
jgi:hypothetical protein